MVNEEIGEEISRTIQGIFRSSPTVLVGSGFSCGYDLPHMGELGDHLVSTLGSRLSSEEAKSVWANALVAIRADLETGLNAIPNGAKGRDEIVQLLRELTADLIIRRTAAAELKILKDPRLHLHAPARLLKWLSDGAPQNSPNVSVITTNYDTLIELFCDIAGLPVDTGFEGFRRRSLRDGELFRTQYVRSVVTDRKKASYDHRARPTVRLLKPHGSITWLSTDVGPKEVLNEHSSAPRAIVVPGPSKYEDALINTLFDKVRSEMNKTLSQATSLLSIGFGFNDEHLQGIIRARLDAGMPALILTRDLTQSAQALIAKHNHVVAIFRDGDGAGCRWKDHEVTYPTPLWQLNPFLSHFIE